MSRLRKQVEAVVIGVLAARSSDRAAEIVEEFVREREKLARAREHKRLRPWLDNNGGSSR
jgi:hypothetical protein